MNCLDPAVDTSLDMLGARQLPEDLTDKIYAVVCLLLFPLDR